MITKHVQDPWFSFIKKRKKTVEGRLHKGSFQNLTKGDIILWKNGSKSCKTTIVSIHKHQNFKTMLNQHRLHNVLPGIKTISNGLDIYSTFYSEEDVQKYGVLAIKIKVVI
jgi:ASC-1-like (ASCH) protein